MNNHLDYIENALIFDSRKLTDEEVLNWGQCAISDKCPYLTGYSIYLLALLFSTYKPIKVFL
jgi:hypothetical protein